MIFLSFQQVNGTFFPPNTVKWSQVYYLIDGFITQFSTEPLDHACVSAVLKYRLAPVTMVTYEAAWSTLTSGDGPIRPMEPEDPDGCSSYPNAK